jgi:hypothetical protein
MASTLSRPLRLAAMFALACCALAIHSSASAAPPTLVSPAPGANYELGRSLEFSVRYDSSGWQTTSRLKVRFSTSAAVGANGVLSSGTTLTYPSGYGPAFTFTAWSSRPTTAGTYYWQAYADAYNDGWASYPLEVGAIQSFQAVVPQGPAAYSPADATRYRMTAGGSITFRVSGQSTVFDSGDLLVSRSPAVDASGKLGSDVTSGLLGTSAYGSASFTAPSYLDITNKPGTYYWQAALRTYGTTTVVYSAVQSFTIVAPQGLGADGVLRRDGIPGWAGTRGSWPYRINASFGIPSYVSAQWFHDLAKMSASRWGLTYGGTTAAIPGLRDGISSVGFSYAVPAGVLGVQSTGLARRTKWVRSCKRVRGKRTCRSVRRVQRVPVEKDLQISRAYIWEEGPAYPLSTDYDLESVLIHEFGHMASDFNVHVDGCVNSPMIRAAGPGDWWRSPTDWARAGCGQRQLSNGDRAAKPGRGLHFKHVTYEVTDRQRATAP